MTKIQSSTSMVCNLGYLTTTIIHFFCVLVQFLNPKDHKYLSINLSFINFLITFINFYISETVFFVSWFFNSSQKLKSGSFILFVYFLLWKEVSFETQVVCIPLIFVIPVWFFSGTAAAKDVFT